MSFSKDQAITTFGTTVEMWRTAPPFSYCEEECAFILTLGNPSVKSKNIFSRHISFFLGGSLLNLLIFRIPLLFFSFYFASVMPLFRVVHDTKIQGALLFRVVHDTKKPEGCLGYDADAINFVSLATPN